MDIVVGSLKIIKKILLAMDIAGILRSEVYRCQPISADLI